MSSGSPRPVVPAMRPDLDSRAAIERLVRDFYREVAMDDVLGPVFAKARVDWSVHLPKMVDFWSWQLLGEHRYGRNPLRAHARVHAEQPFVPAMYERWLELFDTTIDLGFTGPNAETSKQRAHRMAGAMQHLLAGVSAPGSEPIEPVRAPRG